MKKLGLVLSLVLLSASSLFADYQLTLIDKDGTETKQCIKSYSFSNNLESLARKNGVGFKDVYSEEETMTNKVFMGKPVYRKVFLFDDFTVPSGSAGVYKYTSIVSNNIDKVIDLNFKAFQNNTELLSSSNNMYVIYTNGSSIFQNVTYNKKTKKANIYLRNNKNGNRWNITDLSIIIEYTKITDEVNSASATFKSYLHYVPSSSETEELKSVDLKDTGVRFLENYTYDKDTDSCTDN